MNDPYNLARFVAAQEPVYERVRAELTHGQKTSHWMWFIFPQIAGLGRSPTARAFAISCAEEAGLYAQHAILGPRLSECTRLVNRIEGRTLGHIFGSPDDAKFRSSMTLFAKAVPGNRDFLDALEQYCGGEFDQMTLDRL